MANLENVTTYGAIVGSVLAQERTARKLKQIDVATAVGVGTSTWSRIEKGESALTVDQLKLAAEALQLTPARILSLAAEAEETLSNHGVKVATAMSAIALLGVAGVVPVVGPVLAGILAVHLGWAARRKMAGQRDADANAADITPRKET
jgi:transcriptional regulator with XRE-family HTH domain